MKRTSRLPGIVLIVCGILLFLVQEFILGLIFGGLGLFVLNGITNTNKSVENQQKGLNRPQNSPKQNTSGKSAVRGSSSAASASDAYAFKGSVDQYFLNVLTKNFPGYQIEQNVNTSVLAPQAAGTDSWACACGATNTGKFCSNCGSPMPVSTEWTCKCGYTTSGKFCSNCGSAKPVGGIQSKTGTSAEALTFLLRQNGAAKLAIILCPKNSYNTVAIRSAMDACQKANIPCLRFMREFRNSSDYIVGRIKKALR